MLFTSSLLRLDTLLCANTIALPADVRDTLDLTLQHQLAKGDLAALKAAAHHLKSTVAATGAPIKQSLAFEAIAAYLGARDWNTLRAHVEKSGLTLAARGAEAIIHFERNAEQFARFVFELQSKRVGLGDFAPLFQKRPALKVRLLSRYSPDVHPALEAWLHQASNPAFPTISELMRHRAEFLRTVSTYEASFRDRTSRAARHFIITEARVTETLAAATDEAATQAALLQERRRVMSDLEKALDGKLTIANTEVTAGFENCDVPPFGTLEPWYGHSFTETSGARSRFDAVIDLESQGDRATEAGYICVRHGIVAPPKPPVGHLQKIRQALGLGTSTRPATDPRWVLKGSPWSAPIAANGTTGMLLQQREHGPARVTPWGSASPEHFLVLSSSGGGKTFMGREVLTQALAHGKRVRFIGTGREYPMFFREVLSGSVLELDGRHPVSLNPFSGVTSAAMLDKVLSAMAALLHELLALQDNAALPLLESAIRSAWLIHKESLEIGNIGDALVHTGSPETKALGALVAQVQDVAAPWLSGSCAVPLEGQALLIELDDLRNVSKPLASTLERTVLGLLHLEALRNPRPSVHLYEELYGFTPSARYVKRMATDCSAAGTSIGLTSQSLLNVMAEGFGQGLFHPEMTILQLYLKSTDHFTYEKHLGMSEAEVDILRHLRISGRNTQVALVRNRVIEGVFEFALEPFTRLTYATSVREWSRIMERVRTGESYMDAVRTLAAQEQEREGL